jgi:proteic killer suppression protein
MIKSFAQPWLEEFWHTGKHKRVPPDLGPRLLRKMDMLNRAARYQDLQAPPANHLHALHGHRQGQWAISVSGSWRLCFPFESGDILDLELVQYH